MPVLETQRLLLRPLAADDFDRFAAIVADVEVMRFLSGPQDPIAAWRTMAVFLGHDALRGWSNNAVVEKSSGRLVGRAGLWQPEGWPGLEIGWLLDRSVWGRGYATEAAAAWRDYAFDVLQADEVISVIDPANVRSIAVAERIGHTYQRDWEWSGRVVRIYGQRSHP